MFGICIQIILGEDREQTGRLLSIDQNDGVVQMDGAAVKIIPYPYLCKMKETK